MKLDLGNTTLASTGDAGTSAPSYTMDLLAAPFRGIEGLAHGVYNLADWVTFDMLPNWDEGRVFGRSETTPGALLEGLVQFAVPFGAIGKGLGAAGQAARASKSTGLLGKGAKALTKPRHKVKSRGKFVDTLFDPRLNWKGALATEMATDFVAWDGQEERLSNLIQQFPALQNPVTQFLAADPDDNEAYGRAKNVLEGMLIGAGLTALFTPVMAGLRAIKKRKAELEAGASDEDAITSASLEHADAMREALPSKWETITETKDGREVQTSSIKGYDDQGDEVELVLKWYDGEYQGGIIYENHNRKGGTTDVIVPKVTQDSLENGDLSVLDNVRFNNKVYTTKDGGKKSEAKRQAALKKLEGRDGEPRVRTDDTAQLASREAADEFDDIYRAADGDPEDFVEMDLANTDWDKVEDATAMSREEFEAIEAGGRVIDEVETDTAVIKKYKFENGSTQTVKIDKINPLDISAFPKQKGMWAEETLTNEEVLESTANTLELIKKGEGDFAIDLLMGLNNQKTFENVYQAVKGTNQFGDLSDTSRMLLSETQVQDVPTYLFKLGKKLDEIKASKSKDVSAFPKQAFDKETLKERFKGSELINEDGTPIMVFHGTKTSGITEFNKDKRGLIFVTTDPELASVYPLTGHAVPPTQVRERLDASSARTKEKILQEEAAKRNIPVDSDDYFNWKLEFQQSKEFDELYEKSLASDRKAILGSEMKPSDKDLPPEKLIQKYADLQVMPLYPYAEKVFDTRDAEAAKIFKDYFNSKAFRDYEKGRTREIGPLGRARFDFEIGQKRWNEELDRSIETGDWSSFEHGGFLEHIKDLGYDGLRVSENHYKKDFTSLAVFDSGQLKSPYANVGKFDFEDPDILKSPPGLAELSMRNIEGQPVHPIMQRVEEGKSTVSDIVADLEKTFPDSPFNSLMRKLQTAVGGDAKIMGMDELLELRKGDATLTRLKEEGRSASLRTDDGNVVIGINKDSEAPVETILHEGVHAVTVQKMHPHLLKHGLFDIEFTDVAARAKAIDALLKDKSVPKAVKNYAKIIKFLDTVADEVSAKSGLLEVDYWRDPKELITLGLTNREFGNALKGINYTEDKTLWQSLIDAIKSLLGIRPNHKANTAFDALVKAGDDLFALKAQEPRRTADTAFDVSGSADVGMADDFEFTGLRRVGDKALGEDLANKIKTENKSDFITISRKGEITDLDAEEFKQHDPLEWKTTMGTNKPVGLWFAQGVDWLKFIDQKMPIIAKHAHQLDLNWDNIIKVDKVSLAGFESKYGVDSPDGRLIDWRKVAEDWSGVWVELDGIESDWTKGWDLSSGAVWGNTGLKNSKHLGGVSQEPRRTADTAFDVSGSPKVKKTIENVDAKLETGGEQAIRQTGSGMAKSGPTIEGGLRQDEMYEVIRQTGERLNEKGIKPARHGEEASAEEVGRQLARYTGADGKTIEGMIAAAKDNPEKLAEIETNMNALRSLMASNAEDIVDLAHRFADGRKNLTVEEVEILEARIKNAVEMQFNLQASVSQIASGFGRGLRATRYKARRIGLSEAELANEKLRQEYLRKRGSMSTEEVVNKIILARDKDGGGDIWDHLVNVNKEIRDMEGGKFMSMIRESYIGSLLFGPRTSVINTLGNSIAGNIKQFERYVGGWLSAEPAVRKGVIDSMSYSIFSKQLWEFVSNVWRNGDSLLDAGGSSFKGDRGNERVVGAITGENFAQSIDALRGTQGALEGWDTFKSVIDFIGKFFRFPMKVLVSTDEMYKQLEFRRRATAQLTHKAMTDLGMTDSKQISEYVVNTMEALVTSTGRAFSEASLVKEAQGIADNMKFESAVEREMFMADKVEQLRNEKLDFARQQGLVDSDNNINALEQLANEWVEPNLESARVATFTNELGPVSRRVSGLIEAASRKNIPGWLFLPFIKAPTNILKFGFSRLGAPATALGQFALSKPFPGLSNARDSYLKALKSPDPIKRAEARGKLATGVVAWTALYTAISNTDKITGGGPLDPRQNKAWRAAGFMPYSIKVNDTWVSYQRLDPVATMVGTIADLASVVDDNQHGYDKDMMERAVSASMISISRNLTNKSYLSGINNFMQALIEPEISATSVIGRTMAGFIPNFLSQGQSITGDQTIKEANTIWDHTLKKLPFGADRVDLKRNVLGEAAKADMFETTPFQILNPFNPIAWSSKTNDPVLREMAHLHHGFSQPSHMLNRLVNLTEYTQSNGRTAYDRWLALTSEVSVRNNTLRQALEKLIKSNQYQRLAPESSPGLPSPRVALLNRVISQYRQEALDQLFEEFPDIKYQYEQTVVAKQSLRQGSSFQDALQLLNQ